MKHRLTASVGIGACVLAAVAVTIAEAQEFERKRTVEVFASGAYLLNGSADYDGRDYEFNETYAGGVGVGYHFSNHLMAGFNLNVGSTTIDGYHRATFGANPTTRREDVLTTLVDLGVEYNFLNAKFTPFIAAGIGFKTYFDLPTVSSSSNKLIVYHADTFFTPKAGVGVRYNFTDHLFAKVMYKAGYDIPVGFFDSGFFSHGAYFMVGGQF